MHILSALWVLMPRCNSTRASVPTVLRIHPYISSCVIKNSVGSYMTHLWRCKIHHSLSILHFHNLMHICLLYVINQVVLLGTERSWACPHCACTIYNVDDASRDAKGITQGFMLAHIVLCQYRIQGFWSTWCLVLSYMNMMIPLSNAR